MSVLDQPDRWVAIDPQSMRSLVESFPDQVREAAVIARRLSFQPGPRPENVVVTGLGGSAIGGDVACSVLGSCLAVPLIVNRDYALPGFVDSGSLVLACSYSGNTEETLSAYQQARRAKARMICITSGGRLAGAAREDGIDQVSIPGGLPPRAAFGYSSLTILGCLHALGLCPDPAASFDETSSLMTLLLDHYSPAVPEARNPAKRMARSLHGRIVAVYGSSGVLSAAAMRWRSQLEENAKHLAFHHVLPEMNHNELVGWSNPEQGLSGLGVVFLRDKGEHPQVKRRFELTREVIEKKAAVVHEVWSEGDSPLARVFSVTYLGDFVSLYLAYLNSVDPTPVAAIETFKKRLSERC